MISVLSLSVIEGDILRQSLVICKGSVEIGLREDGVSLANAAYRNC